MTSDSKLEHITEQEVLVRARAGAIKEDCIWEGMALAVKLKVLVRLMHNDKVVLIDPAAMYGVVVETEP